MISMVVILLGEKCGVCYGKVVFLVFECWICYFKKKEFVVWFVLVVVIK